MMLQTFLTRVEHRYAFAGALFGCLLPVLCIILDYFVWDFPVSTMFVLSGATEAVALVLMPLFFGCGFYLIGKSKARLMAELAERRQTEAQLSHQAYHDRLTGLANRFCLERDVMKVADEPRSETGAALLLLDLDRFKFVNDSLGHSVGDELLVAIALRLRQVLCGQAAVYRLGGDEFVVTVAGRPSHGKIEDVCWTICALFSEPFELSRGMVSTGCSIGVTFMEPEDASMSVLLKRADLALYGAKDIPGNSFRFFDAALAEEAQRRAEIEHDMERALKAGEFFLEYQPIVGVESRAIRSFEALLRWRHPTKGVIPPDVFIPLAEKTGFILPLGNWVVREACREAAGWPSPTGVAVNVVGDQFKDRDFVDHVGTCLAESGLAAGRLTIEVTESIFSIDQAVIRDSLADLRSRGVRVALDDFGIGFSSINNLRTFPLDQLKVDRSFAQAMLTSSRDAELVDIILKLGQTFDVSTTIEGIETEGQMEFIRLRGAAEAQGFLISRPVPAGDVLAFLAEPERLASA
jgi:diguanylate cyclase (GGDEF)-like protein